MSRGQVRIIGGTWRGRKLAVPELAGLRPTPDRVRETLFNWLAPLLPGARCLDLFAGSGALGFEALSRGASQVVMLDQSKPVVALLKEQQQLFNASQATIYQATMPHDWSFLRKIAIKTFDIVFLDPPYRENLLLPLCFMLEEKKLLADTAYIYLETDSGIEEKQLPPPWELLKSKKAGQVSYYLAKRQSLINPRIP
jgi:16S rRNA (guanine966-N2)-methyltransferase